MMDINGLSRFFERSVTVCMIIQEILYVVAESALCLGFWSIRMGSPISHYLGYAGTLNGVCLPDCVCKDIFSVAISVRLFTEYVEEYQLSSPSK